MIPTSDTKSGMVPCYVNQLPLRSANARRVYRCIINGFQRFVSLHSPTGTVSHQVLVDWLHERATQWPAHMVIHRACVVDRFLNWLVSNGSLDSNPIARLRTQYGATDTTSIIRALLAPEPAKALGVLRPPPRFASFLGPQMHDHVTLMRAMGFRYLSAEAGLLRFDRFLQGHPELVTQPIDALVREWTGSDANVMRACSCLYAGRIVAKALRRHEPAITLPTMDSNLMRQMREQRRRPYVFTEDEVHKLFVAVGSFSAALAPTRPQCAYLMLVLAYCVGLRVGEITRLTLGDLDLDEGTIEIRESKFFKSRRLPVSPSVIAALRRHLDFRRSAGAPTDAAAGLFWHTHPPGAYSYVMVRWLLQETIQRAGLRSPGARTGPRVHDLRHTFVVHRMLTWYREGINPQLRLPFLATYLGHKDINSTLVYLTITQDLLQQAGMRFHSFAAGVLHDLMGEAP